MVNIAAAQNEDVNYFLIESDFMKQLFVYIQKISRKNLELAESLRTQVLMLYMNLFSEKILDERFLIRNLSIILGDYQNRKKNMKLIFKCLRKISKIEGIWEKIKEVEPCILTSIEEIMAVLRCYNHEEYEEFLNFINEVLSRSDFALKIYDFMDPYLILKKVQEFNHAFNSKNKVRILKSVRIFSQLVWIKNFFHTREETIDFIMILMNPNLILHQKYGKYCIRSLVRLLRDKTFLHEMLDHGLLDNLLILFENKLSTVLILEMIDLVQKVIEVWESIR